MAYGGPIRTAPWKLAIVTVLLLGVGLLVHHWSGQKHNQDRIFFLFLPFWFLLYGWVIVAFGIDAWHWLRKRFGHPAPPRPAKPVSTGPISTVQKISNLLLLASFMFVVAELYRTGKGGMVLFMFIMPATFLWLLSLILMLLGEGWKAIRRSATKSAPNG